jgi:hypothetical protein
VRFEVDNYLCSSHNITRVICRTAVKDLATVQGLVSQLLRYDAVTFLTLLEGVRLSEGASSIWLFHEATHFMYEQVGQHHMFHVTLQTT